MPKLTIRGIVNARAQHPRDWLLDQAVKIVAFANRPQTSLRLACLSLRDDLMLRPQPYLMAAIRAEFARLSNSLSKS